MKLQHEFSADPILEHTVGLCPIPFAANCQGQRSTTFIRIVGDELTKEVDVAGAYVTFTVSKYRSHGENITDIVVDRTLFF